MSGRLRERVRVEAEVRSPDGGGGFSFSWEAVATLWASVEPLKGVERLQAMQLQGSNLFKVTLRNDGPAVDPAHRLVWLTGGNVVLNIREAPVTPRDNLFREIVAEAGVDEIRVVDPSGPEPATIGDYPLGGG